MICRILRSECDDEAPFGNIEGNAIERVNGPPVAGCEENAGVIDFKHVAARRFDAGAASRAGAGEDQLLTPVSASGVTKAP